MKTAAAEIAPQRLSLMCQ